MLIGTMNHPERPVLEEIAWMADAGMEFLDLTFEPPATASWEVDTRGIRDALERSHMAVVGHTALVSAHGERHPRNPGSCRG